MVCCCSPRRAILVRAQQSGKAPAMINRYAALFGALGVLFAGYTVWWFHAADQLEAEFPKILDDALPPGAALSQRVTGVDGFPFRLNVALADVKVTWGDGDWAATPSLTGIFQPGTADHVILHLDAPVQFHVQGATGTLNAERGLASLVGYEEGELQVDGDAVNVVLEQPPAMPVKARRAQFHLRRSTDGSVPAFAISAKGLTPASAASGRLEELLARYGEPQPGGTVDISIDERADVFHAGGKTLDPAEAQSLKQLF
ncbi:MAG: DUF2125 domain-containing protein [Alphaproteobacteria bacterium]|nr:DUF2125 domain-containing protein [Alphaproteobacteria bacterium]